MQGGSRSFSSGTSSRSSRSPATCSLPSRTSSASTRRPTCCTPRPCSPGWHRAAGRRGEPRRHCASGLHSFQELEQALRIPQGMLALTSWCWHSPQGCGQDGHDGRPHTGRHARAGTPRLPTQEHLTCKPVADGLVLRGRASRFLGCLGCRARYEYQILTEI